MVQIDPSVKLVFSSFIGKISEDEFRLAVSHLPLERGFDPAFSHIIDFSGITVANISTGFVKDLARQHSLFSRNAVQIIVAPQTHIFGLARMAQILRGEQFGRLEVVHSLDEAYEILGIERSRHDTPLA